MRSGSHRHYHTSTSVWWHQELHCNYYAGLAGELAPPDTGTLWPQQIFWIMLPLWYIPKHSVNTDEKWGGWAETSHFFNCYKLVLSLSKLRGFYWTLSVFPHCLWRTGLMTHQLCIWRHFLVFAVVSLELFVGHELQSSVRRAKKTRNITLCRQD